MKRPGSDEQLRIKVIPPKLLMIVSLIAVVVVAVSVALEYRARRRDYLKLLENQASLFINTLTVTAQNSLYAAEMFEDEINNRILANLKVVEKYDRMLQLSSETTSEILKMTQFDEVHVYNNRGESEILISLKNDIVKPVPYEILKSKLNERFDSFVFTLYDYPDLDKERIVFLIPRERGGFIAALISIEHIKTIRSYFGFGYFLKRFQSEENIEYIVLQNSETIVAGSFNGYSISSFSKDMFLNRVLSENKTQTRILDYDDRSVYEAVSPFFMNDESVGVLRLGLSLTEYEELASDVQKRLYLFAAILIVIGLIFGNLMISYRHRYLLRRDLTKLQDYTNTILDNLHSSVISIDHNNCIQTVNKQALSLLNKDMPAVYHKTYSVLPQSIQTSVEDCMQSEDYKIAEHEIKLDWNNEKRYINVRTKLISDEDSNNTCVLLLDDVTEQKRYEEQLRRNQKLTAMRNLASSVAHEIKNPLNAIQLIIYSIKRRNRSLRDVEANNKNLETVEHEIGRISEIVNQYLKYSRPPELNMKTLDFVCHFKEIAALFSSELKSSKIIFRKRLQSHKPIQGDADQLKQVFINLIRNSKEAIKPPGEILVTGEVKDNFYEIRVSDNGRGIPESNISSIFDLHFTTKKNGSGIGLSIVQQIILAHDGSIRVESEEGRGTTFILQFPF